MCGVWCALFVSEKINNMALKPLSTNNTPPLGGVLGSKGGMLLELVVSAFIVVVLVGLSARFVVGSAKKAKNHKTVQGELTSVMQINLLLKDVVQKVLGQDRYADAMRLCRGVTFANLSPSSGGPATGSPGSEDERGSAASVQYVLSKTCTKERMGPDGVTPIPGAWSLADCLQGRDTDHAPMHAIAIPDLGFATTNARITVQNADVLERSQSGNPQPVAGMRLVYFDKAFFMPSEVYANTYKKIQNDEDQTDVIVGQTLDLQLVLSFFVCEKRLKSYSDTDIRAAKCTRDNTTTATIKFSLTGPSEDQTARYWNPGDAGNFATPYVCDFDYKKAHGTYTYKADDCVVFKEDGRRYKIKTCESKSKLKPINLDEKNPNECIPPSDCKCDTGYYPDGTTCRIEFDSLKDCEDHPVLSLDHKICREKFLRDNFPEDSWKNDPDAILGCGDRIMGSFCRHLKDKNIL